MAPTIRYKPRPYQRAIIDKTYNTPNLALFLEQGLGKTKIDLDCTMLAHDEGLIDCHIVISRKMVVENWYLTEVKKHITVPHVAYFYSTTSRKHLPDPKNLNKDHLKFIFINDGCVRTKHGEEFLKKVLSLYKCKVTIDESTIIKNPTTQVTKKLTKLCKTAVQRRILSGEPAPQGPVDYFSQYRFLSPEILNIGTFTAYKNIFIEQEEMWINGRKIMKPTRKFNAGAKEVFESSVKPYTIRLRKSDVLKELPDKEYITRSYMLPLKVAKAYNKLRDEFRIELEDLSLKGELTATLAVSRAIRLHQMVCGHVFNDDKQSLEQFDSGRFDVLCDIIDERPLNSKTIIWAHYRASIENLVEQLNKRYGAGSAVKIYGGMTDNDRRESLHQFQKGNAKYLVANPASAGWGLTLVEADASVYYANSYNYEHRVQSEDRNHRIGQLADKVQYYDIVAADTVDTKMLNILGDKADFSKSVLNGYQEWFS